MATTMSNELAINGGTPVSAEPVPFMSPALTHSCLTEPAVFSGNL